MVSYVENKINLFKFDLLFREPKHHVQKNNKI